MEFITNIMSEFLEELMEDIDSMEVGCFPFSFKPEKKQNRQIKTNIDNKAFVLLIMSIHSNKTHFFLLFLFF